MAKSQRVYTPEFRRQMVELHRTGRNFDELAKEFGCTSWSIRQWVKQADRDVGRGDGGLSTAERQELTRLRRENRQLKEEREKIWIETGMMRTATAVAMTQVSTFCQTSRNVFIKPQ